MRPPFVKRCALGRLRPFQRLSSLTWGHRAIQFCVRHRLNMYVHVFVTLLLLLSRKLFCPTWFQMISLEFLPSMFRILLQFLLLMFFQFPLVLRYRLHRPALQLFQKFGIQLYQVVQFKLYEFQQSMLRRPCHLLLKPLRRPRLRRAGASGSSSATHAARELAKQRGLRREGDRSRLLPGKGARRIGGAARRPRAAAPLWRSSLGSGTSLGLWSPAGSRSLRSTPTWGVPSTFCSTRILRQSRN